MLAVLAVVGVYTVLNAGRRLSLSGFEVERGSEDLYSGSCPGWR